MDKKTEVKINCEALKDTNIKKWASVATETGGDTKKDTLREPKKTDRKDYNMFDTLGEFVRKPLNEYVFDAEIIKRIEMAVGDIKGHKKHIHYFSIGQGRDGYEITCILQGKNETKLKEGTYRAYIFNCDKPELSKFEEITVKKNWMDMFVRADEQLWENVKIFPPKSN